ncbi:hypothetical protein KJ849_03425 [bacterium]|nr:hypothetical protein [bacterium]
MKFIHRLLLWLEVVLGIVIVVIVVFGLYLIVVSITQVQTVSLGKFHIIFETILSDLLLLIVGLEMAVMMIQRRMELLPEILAFVVGRKLLLMIPNTYELIIWVLAVGALFAIRKYLTKCEGCLKFERLILTGEIRQDKKDETVKTVT